ncbi:UDP-3-O-(3-hydroxymyristoyl)glucosamine N-acyltransferase [Sediminicurvatus halobius]|uniref:UDP-3-O-acylglucosamine N-acyltransferase n=1 Tax=Sediminicurvatus halobius TaxID=2182432 RepID=A0A2U2N4L0_9GAMM|nr:UDP-3-O-(3-hydroxymyristoyl)glucosamine N-acyltransferase [Spiribacter halobius]PWG63914.1 UDP-3-O-(3-hydroxymyristoyl)glucosamine N-acyltransferase [Spiribacter halobius]UEX76327.1 UDP-3-O-(3-hydroxymyristoyl)glucosamine N-acyltransferase [Spiribacter halobius]
MGDDHGVSLQTLAELTGARLVGDGSRRIDRVAPLQHAGPGAISFLANSKYRRYLAETGASAVVVRPADADGLQLPALLSDNPYLCYARIARHLNPLPPVRPGVHPSAVVAPDAEIADDAEIGPQASIGGGARIGPRCLVGPGCVLGAGVVLGADCRLEARVTVYHGCRLGERVRVHGGVVIGADGFGFAAGDAGWEPVPQLGGVVIGNDVDIGANTTIDRGALEDTEVGDGVKIDNLVQIAHNVSIGEHTVIAGCTGVSGSTRIGRRCTIGGGVGIAGHLYIADDTVLTGMTMVTHDVREPGLYSSGVTISPAREWRRNAVRFHQLDDMARRLRALERWLRDRGEDSENGKT